MSSKRAVKKLVKKAKSVTVKLVDTTLGFLSDGFGRVTRYASYAYADEEILQSHLVLFTPSYYCVRV